MEGRGTYLRVGLLVVFGLAAVAALLVFFAGPRVRQGADFETYFRESVQGLDNGAPVKFRGVTLGLVTGIGLASAAYASAGGAPERPSTYALVYVRFRIDLSKIGPQRANLDDAIDRGLRAHLASQGLTGVSYLELDFVNPAHFPPLSVPWTPRDTYIPSIPSTLSQVQDAAQMLLERLNQVDLPSFAAAATGLVADLREELRSGDLHMLLAQTTRTVQTLDAALVQADLPGLSAELRHTLAGLDNTADGPRTRALIAGANTAVTRLTVALGQLPPLVASLQQTVRRANDSTADVQQALTPALRDLQAILGDLRDTGAQLRADPGQVLWGGPPPREAGAR
jgi:paraquat-inducible protein B